MYFHYSIILTLWEVEWYARFVCCSPPHIYLDELKCLNYDFCIQLPGSLPVRGLDSSGRGGRGPGHPGGGNPK